MPSLPFQGFVVRPVCRIFEEAHAQAAVLRIGVSLHNVDNEPGARKCSARPPQAIVRCVLGADRQAFS